MNRRFRLGTVERLRQEELAARGRALAVARAELASARAARDQLHATLLACRAPDVSTPAELRAAGERRVLLRERLDAADLYLAELSRRASGAKDEWLAARNRLRAVEALHERFREGQRVEEARQAQRLADELAGFRRLQRAGSTGQRATG